MDSLISRLGYRGRYLDMKNNDNEDELPSGVAFARKSLLPLESFFLTLGFEIDRDYEFHKLQPPSSQPVRLKKVHQSHDQFVVPRCLGFGGFGLTITLGYGDVPPIWPDQGAKSFWLNKLDDYKAYNWLHARNLLAIPFSINPDYAGEQEVHAIAFETAKNWFSDIGTKWLESPMQMPDDEWEQHGLQVLRRQSRWPR